MSEENAKALNEKEEISQMHELAPVPSQEATTLTPEENGKRLLLEQTGEWQRQRDAVLAKTSALKAIAEDDNAAFATTTNALAALKVMQKDLEKERKSITTKLDLVKKSIMNTEKQLVGGIVSEIDRLTDICNAYVKRQNEKAEQARREAAEREAALAMQQEQAEKYDLDADFNQLSPIKPEDLPVKPQSDAVRTSEVWIEEVINPMEVPRMLCSPDELLIRQHLANCKRQGMRIEDVNIPGVKVKVEYRFARKA